jgi:hypothetical protein
MHGPYYWTLPALNPDGEYDNWTLDIDRALRIGSKAQAQLLADTLPKGVCRVVLESVVTILGAA